MARPFGATTYGCLTDSKLLKIHVFILKNCKEIDEDIKEHMEVLEKENVSNIQIKHNLEFPQWFEERIPDASFPRGTITNTLSIRPPSPISIGLPSPTTGRQQADCSSNSIHVGSDHSIGCASNNVEEIEELVENENDL
ncbi:hypothetical protein ACH5RR_037181 [Cinchona calisaya]|uniref:Uncharacterized protein n=1 Tax=Cinchona calisaya TaxID=153742 RepID=A0ABD2Y8I2_9GENT